jgi:hypothetical protein
MKCVLGLGVAVLTALPATAITTTYVYTGAPYTTIIAPTPADAARFGTNMTGAVTFDFDTTGVTGSFGLNDITNLSLVSGVYSATTNFSSATSFTLTNY